MQFGTLSFWLFFVGFLGIYGLARPNVFLRNLLLLAVSYLLAFLWDGRLILLVVLSTVVAYAAGIALPRSRHPKRILAAAILFQLGMLAVWKYAGFFLGSFTELLGLMGYVRAMPEWNILLPIGISFYTFSIIDYLVQVHRKSLPPERDLVAFALFVAFFPKLIAGPVERAQHLLPQFRERTKPDPDRGLSAVTLIAWGLVQKFCIGDNAHIIATALFQQPIPPGFSVLFALAVWIYADFSGYTDIARGMAALLGFELLENFRMPYLATSITDFWRRWHISLSEWFRDYVYIPLGGSRAGLSRTVINLFITMVLVGLWHGAQWTFVAWGAYHGILLALHRVMIAWRNAVPGRSRFAMPPVLGIICTFALTSFGWLLFSAGNMTKFFSILPRLHFSVVEPKLPGILLLASPIALMHALCVWKQDLHPVPRLPWWLQTAFFVLAFYALFLLPPFVPESFLYVRF